MTPKEYLGQAYRLNHRIAWDTDELRSLKELTGSISSIRYDKEPVQTSRNPDAPFISSLEKLWELEETIAAELKELSALKEQIREVIATVDDPDERLVLQYRYIAGMTWVEIGRKLDADRTTVYRWHDKALQHLRLPETPIVI